MSDDNATVRLKLRDDLLSAVVAKLERRRDTQPMAGQVRRLVALIASLERSERSAPDFAERLTDVVGERVEMFAKLTGREKPPSRRLRPLKIKLTALASHFRDLQQEAPLASSETPRLRRQQVEWWRDQITEAWHTFLREKAAPPPSVIDAVLAARTPRGRAERLIYEGYSEPDEGFDDFRRKLARVELKLTV